MDQTKAARPPADQNGDALTSESEAPAGGGGAPSEELVRARVWTSQTVEATEGLQQLEKKEEVAHPLREAHPRSRTRNVGDRVFEGITTGFAVLIVLILALMVGLLAYQSRLSIQKVGFNFLTGSTWDTTRDIYGATPEILGTIYSSMIALVLAAPVAIMVAIFLTELAPRWMRFSMGFVIELLAAVPSIVFGLWALLFLVPNVIAPHVQPFFVDHFGNTPVLSGLFTGYPTGFGIFTASIILAVMILPTIASIGRDVMMAVPNAQRDAMLALGGTRWETTWKAVIPYARSGIIGGIILGLGRAVGETMAVQMVIGNHHQISPSLFQPSTTMAASIVLQLQEATGDLYRSALIELALILMLITVFLNIVARLLVWRVAR